MRIALAGNPNSGKTTLFNRLTGLRQKTSNLSGTTVEIYSALWQGADSDIWLLDLPGSYGIPGRSEEEALAAGMLLGTAAGEKPDAVIYVADASNLKRSLLLCSRIADLGFPVVIALNMLDVATTSGWEVDVEELSAGMGILVVPVNARTGRGTQQLFQQVKKARSDMQRIFWEGSGDYSDFVLKHSQIRENGGVFVLAAEDNEVHAELEQRMEKIDEVVRKCMRRNPLSRQAVSKKLDRVLLHPVFGYAAFVLIMYFLFQAVFTLADYPMQWIEQGFGYLTAWTEAILPDSFVSRAFSEGIIAGLGGILVFVPQIAIMFALITFLEDSGYMPRSAFLTDRLMRRLGLNGRSVVPLVGGMACAVPAIMGARTISNLRERLITVMVTPLMSCSARLPVYALLITLAIPEDTHWLGMDARGILLTGMYFFGAVMALLVAGVLNLFFKKTGDSYLMMELPAYQWPLLKNLWGSAWRKSAVFAWEAGRVIILISLLLWILGNTGPEDKRSAIRQHYDQQIAASGAAAADSLEQRRSAELLENSYISMVGHAIEPVIRPLGYDWKTGIAILSSFAAREVFSGTMATLFTVEDPDATDGIAARMQGAKDTVTGKPLYGPAYAFSLMIFYALAMQCISTMAIVKRETGTWKWPLIQFAYMTGLAYLAAFVTYLLAS